LVVLSGFVSAAEARQRGSVGADTVGLERAHAHNDYEHDRPLYDALDHRFKSVEADIWLVDGELVVAHDAEDVPQAAEQGRTLRSLYLEPLRQRVKQNRGSVYRGTLTTSRCS
jgi:hypothetical protein